MSIQDAYNEWSHIYDSNQNRTRDLDEQVLRFALNEQRFPSILEIGCGTGKNTAFLAEIGAQVLALDFSEGMIARAREKVTGSHVRFQFADLTRPWPCAEADFDLIVCLVSPVASASSTCVILSSLRAAATCSPTMCIFTVDFGSGIHQLSFTKSKR